MTAFFPNSSFVEPALDKDTAKLAEGYDVVCIFVNDFLSAEVAEVLAKCGVKLVALRCAGYDRVDVAACAKHGIKVCRVPTYSPESVAEHAVALLFALNRHLHTANIRVRIGNYSLSGLVGMQLKGKVVGVVGTGAIGYEACRIFKGIGCNVIAYDVRPNPKVEALGIKYASLDEMLSKCDIVSLHCPLLPSTRHLVNKETLAKMKDGVVLINVSRGGLIDSDAVIDALEEGKIGALGLDVYENEQDLFFQDHTMYETTQRMGKWDRKFKILTSYPQVLVTPHSAFLTREALSNIAATTVQNIADFKLGRPLVCEVTPPAPAPAPAAAPAAAAARA
ncbi:hypothetical protein HYH03_008455 [Edaphochlamys debaryana]|uniref:Alanine dehydrogenase/pyridine nucleotide transhydrogenase NAD(H)-binding domain-containing protein n=1 Tax=Edaphochlamys debaryana TaxID=47281 RepID=A0A835Y089_9CHLO|nr:hypothetical protein HYH03_008455 [Edaphochlamys debaryana]|eukprot:KAG2493320.1 hypothetical protein HYH03_008455 [Edaphochlamys debaryana]